MEVLFRASNSAFFWYDQTYLLLELEEKKRNARAWSRDEWNYLGVFFSDRLLCDRESFR